MCKYIALVNRSTTQIDSLTSTAYSLFSHTEMAAGAKLTSSQTQIPADTGVCGRQQQHGLFILMVLNATLLISAFMFNK